MAKDNIFENLDHPDDAIRMKAVLRPKRNTDMRAVPALMQLSKTDPNLEIRFQTKKVLLSYRQQVSAENKRTAPKPGPATGAAPGLLEPSPDELPSIYTQLEDTSTSARLKARNALVKMSKEDSKLSVA